MNFLYLEVEEEGNPRKSCDVNFYDAELYVSDIADLLEQAIRHYSLPEEKFREITDDFGAKLLGHVSGGMYRRGNDTRMESAIDRMLKLWDHDKCIDLQSFEI